MNQPVAFRKETSKISEVLATQAKYYVEHPGVLLRRLPERIFRRWPGIMYRRLTASRGMTSVQAAMALFPQAGREKVEALLGDLHNNARFIQETNNLYRQKRNKDLSFFEWNEFIYLMMRLQQPAIAFETGVFDGMSSSCMLQALEDNGKGTLVSVDLPAEEATEEFETPLPRGCQPGWMVPAYLRPRYELHLGDAKDLLPVLFEKYPEIDLFLHDSLHTAEHMNWEYNIAWPHIRAGGFLFSDDILWNTAFENFCKSKQKGFVRVGGVGAVKK